MRTYFRTLIFLCAAALLANPAAADEASHRKAVLELFKLGDMEGMMEKNIDIMVKSQLQMNPGMPGLEPTYKQFMTKYMSWKSLESDFVTIYMKAFSEAELKQMLAFYRTPVGKKALRETPQLLQQGTHIGAERVQKNLPELMQALREHATKEPGEDAQDAPAPAARAPQAAPAAAATAKPKQAAPTTKQP